MELSAYAISSTAVLRAEAHHALTEYLRYEALRVEAEGKGDARLTALLLRGREIKWGMYLKAGDALKAARKENALIRSW